MAESLLLTLMTYLRYTLALHWRKLFLAFTRNAAQQHISQTFAVAGGWVYPLQLKPSKSHWESPAYQQPLFHHANTDRRDSILCLLWNGGRRSAAHRSAPRFVALQNQVHDVVENPKRLL